MRGSIMESMRDRLRGTEPGSRLTRMIEEQTSKVPSDAFLWAAGAAIVGSLVLHVMNRREHSNFVGQWVPTLVALGLYSKLARKLGYD